MAALRVRLYRPAGEELDRLWQGPRSPRWVLRTLETRGSSVDRPAASALVEALGAQVGGRLESLALLLRKAEARGWTVEVLEDSVLVASGLAFDATRRALEADGIWFLVRGLTGAGDAEFV
jgi:hypothetical protein